MTQASQPTARWQIWVVARGDYLRTNTGALRLFDSVDDAKQTATEVGGIVQIEGAPGLGGFDRALT
jgi:hypothetical protein